MIRQIIERLEEPYFLLNGEDVDTRNRLEHRSKQHYLNLLGSKRVLIIDEAQKSPEVGKVDQQEIDWIEDRGGILHAYEFKWNPKKKAKEPAAWKNAYTERKFEVINSDNYLSWIRSE